MRILTLVFIAIIVVSVWYIVTSDRGFIISNEDIKDMATNFLGKSVNLSNKGVAPELRGLDSWINSEPLSIGGLKGKVVLIDFWTYSCINCIRSIPHIAEWYNKYKDDGFVLSKNKGRTDVLSKWNGIKKE